MLLAALAVSCICTLLHYFNRRPDQVALDFLQEMTIYDIDTFDVDYRKLNLADCTHYICNNEELALFNSARKISSHFVWKGSLLGIGKYSDGRIGHFRISLFGYFFEDLETGKFYSIERESTKWNSLYHKITIEVFHPARKNRKREGSALETRI